MSGGRPPKTPSDEQLASSDRQARLFARGAALLAPSPASLPVGTSTSGGASANGKGGVSTVPPPAPVVDTVPVPEETKLADNGGGVSEDRGECGLDGGDADDDGAAPPSIDKGKLVLNWPLAHLHGAAATSKIDNTYRELCELWRGEDVPVNIYQFGRKAPKTPTSDGVVRKQLLGSFEKFGKRGFVSDAHDVTHVRYDFKTGIW